MCDILLNVNKITLRKELILVESYFNRFIYLLTINLFGFAGLSCGMQTLSMTCGI